MALELFCQRDKELIACGMPELVIDMLEFIEVDK